MRREREKMEGINECNLSVEIMTKGTVTVRKKQAKLGQREEEGEDISLKVKPRKS